MATKKELLKRLSVYNLTDPGLKVAELRLYTEQIEKHYGTDYYSSRQPNYDVIISPQYIRPEYCDSIEKRLEHLDIYGWTILPKPEAYQPDIIYNEFLKWLASGCSRFNLEDQSTWINKNLPRRLHGILKQNVGHEDWVWKTRIEYKEYFTKIWGTDDLLCSFDGANFMPGTQTELYSNDRNYTEVIKGWMHIDQIRMLPNKENVQGLVMLTPSGPSDSGLILIEGSHKWFEEYSQLNPVDGWKWNMVNGNTVLNSQKIKEMRHAKICGEVGDIILWDSRTMHQSGELRRSRPRACVYVSMQPRVGCPQKQLDKRIKCFEGLKMTNHWCYGRMFQENMKFSFGGVDPNLPPATKPEMNDEIRRLVGY